MARYSTVPTVTENQETTKNFMDISTIEDKATMMSRNVRHHSIISFTKSPKALGHTLSMSTI